MSPQDLETAHAFVACFEWRWLPGMKAAFCSEEGESRRFIDVDGYRGWPWIGYSDSLAPGTERDSGWGVPDLDDPVTRAALLVVVRKAHRKLTIGITKAGSEWMVMADGAKIASASTEVAALLAALQAAP